MSSLPLALLAIVVVAVLAALAWAETRKRQAQTVQHRSDQLDTLTGWAPQATRLLSLPERNAHDTLCRALPGHLVFAQVPLARFLKVPTRNSYGEWLRRIGSHCADLVVADSLSRVVAVIELRRPVHTSERARRRHDRLSRILQAADIELLIWDENALPTVGEVVALFTPRPDAVPSAPSMASPPVLQDVPPLAARRVASASVPFSVGREAPATDAADAREAPPSTWFDELDDDQGPDTVASDSLPPSQHTPQFNH